LELLGAMRAGDSNEIPVGLAEGSDVCVVLFAAFGDVSVSVDWRCDAGQE
jgi:hypothetical protein